MFIVKLLFKFIIALLIILSDLRTQYFALDLPEPQVSVCCFVYPFL